MALSPIYGGSWTSRADVAAAFQIPLPSLGHVLMAWYDIDEYEGYAFVIGSDADRLWIVEGSDCSCYGLEDQWAPETTDAPTLRQRRWWGKADVAQMVTAALDAWEAARDAHAQGRPV